MRVISLGAGVQSSTLGLMVREGLLEADVALFADTGWEPAAVYRQLEYLTAALPIPVVAVATGDIRADALSFAHRFASMPLFVRNPNGSRAILRRQCTNEYKLKPIRRWLREHGAAARTPAEVLIGFSLDEWGRMAHSTVRYARHTYPLIDARMTRHDCTLWLERHGYPQPPKSACIGCPLHSDAIWREMKRDRPQEWADACAFDAEVRRLPRIKGEVYLHPSLRPLAEVDLSTAEDHGQLNLPGCSPFGCRAEVA